jgi:hypothetical protein
VITSVILEQVKSNKIHTGRELCAFLIMAHLRKALKRGQTRDPRQGEFRAVLPDQGLSELGPFRAN